MKKNNFFIPPIILLFLVGNLKAQCPISYNCTEVNGNPSIVLEFTFSTVPTLNNSEITFTYQGNSYTESATQIGGQFAFYTVPFCAGVNDLDEALYLVLNYTPNNTNCVLAPPPSPPTVCPEIAVCIPAQAPNPPVSSWNCPEGQNIIQITFEDAQNLPSFNNAQFYFQDNPLLDGTYSPCGSVGFDLGGAGNVSYDIPCAGSPNTIVFSPGTESQNTCVYEGGILCETGCDPYLGPDCALVIEACDQGLVDFVVQELGETVFCKQWNGSCDMNNTIWRDGKVAIGTDIFHPDYRLSVFGGVVTDYLRLCDENDPVYWCDYVFEKDYDLWSLYQVDTFIKKYKHLPKTKSEAEIKSEGGFDIQSTILNQQEKIEEIFLHLIELDQQLSSIEETNK